MPQLYFLSILFNGLTGFVLVSNGDDSSLDHQDFEENTRFSLQNETFRLILGILTAITGLLVLLSPYTILIIKDGIPISRGIPILGDLIPALVGLAAGFSLIWSFYRGRSTAAGGKVAQLGETFFKYKKWMGFIIIAVAALHFLFPQALFL
ncbi:MAG: hypothetical protein LBN21_08180 [Treponema sp.]|jgi:hypothetical protein|nr:hypothetical protein [Treponema sp.]